MSDFTSNPIPSSELLAQKALAAQQVSELNRAMMRLGPAGALDAAFKIQSPRGRSGASPMPAGIIGAPNDQDKPPDPALAFDAGKVGNPAPGGASSAADMLQLLNAWYQSRK